MGGGGRVKRSRRCWKGFGEWRGAEERAERRGSGVDGLV